MSAVSLRNGWEPRLFPTPRLPEAPQHICPPIGPKIPVLPFCSHIGHYGICHIYRTQYRQFGPFSHQLKWSLAFRGPVLARETGIHLGPDAPVLSQQFRKSIAYIRDQHGCECGRDVGRGRNEGWRGGGARCSLFKAIGRSHRNPSTRAVFVSRVRRQMFTFDFSCLVHVILLFFRRYLVPLPAEMLAHCSIVGSWELFLELTVSRWSTAYAPHDAARVTTA